VLPKKRNGFSAVKCAHLSAYGIHADQRQRAASIPEKPVSLRDEIGGSTMEPIMCPFCGGTNLFQEDDYSLQMDFEYWTIHHWECLDCAQSFDKIEILPTSSTFEEINESTIH